jgi:hypothetical protein
MIPEQWLWHSVIIKFYESSWAKAAELIQK